VAPVERGRKMVQQQQQQQQAIFKKRATTTTEADTDHRTGSIKRLAYFMVSLDLLTDFMNWFFVL
jgi:hypothetical protein